MPVSCDEDGPAKGGGCIWGVFSINDHTIAQVVNALLEILDKGGVVDHTPSAAFRANGCKAKTLEVPEGRYTASFHPASLMSSCKRAAALLWHLARSLIMAASAFCRSRGVVSVACPQPATDSYEQRHRQNGEVKEDFHRTFSCERHGNRDSNIEHPGFVYLITRRPKIPGFHAHPHSGCAPVIPFHSEYKRPPVESYVHRELR